MKIYTIKSNKKHVLTLETVELYNSNKCKGEGVYIVTLREHLSELTSVVVDCRHYKRYGMARKRFNALKNQCLL